MADNVFKKMGFIPDATFEDIRDEAILHASEVIKNLQKFPKINADMILQILAASVRIGVMADGKIDEQERRLIKEVFAEICDGTYDEVLKAIDRPLDDRTYKIAEDLLKMSTSLGMEFVNLSICFAYADGVFEDEVSQKLSDIVTENVHLIQGNPGGGMGFGM